MPRTLATLSPAAIFLYNFEMRFSLLAVASSPGLPGWWRICTAGGGGGAGGGGATRLMETEEEEEEEAFPIGFPFGALKIPLATFRFREKQALSSVSSSESVLRFLLRKTVSYSYRLFRNMNVYLVNVTVWYLRICAYWDSVHNQLRTSSCPSCVWAFFCSSPFAVSFGTERADRWHRG